MPMIRLGWPASHPRAILLAAMLAEPGTAALGAERSFESASQYLDCRYSTDSPSVQSSAEDTPGPAESVLLPDNDVFRPLLADQREARFYADYRLIRFKNSSNVLSEGQGR